MTSIFAPGLELDADTRDEIVQASEFLAAAAELYEITEQAAEDARADLAEARAAVDQADERHQRSARAVDAANTKLRALCRASGLVQTADGYTRGPVSLPAPTPEMPPAHVSSSTEGWYAMCDHDAHGPLGTAAHIIAGPFQFKQSAADEVDKHNAQAHQ